MVAVAVFIVVVLRAKNYKRSAKMILFLLVVVVFIVAVLIPVFLEKEIKTCYSCSHCKINIADKGKSTFFCTKEEKYKKHVDLQNGCDKHCNMSLR